MRYLLPICNTNITWLMLKLNYEPSPSLSETRKWKSTHQNVRRNEWNRIVKNVEESPDNDVA